MTAVPDVTWARSSFCGSGGCVEVALDDGVVLVRDSKLGADSPVQEWTPAEWCDLSASAKSGLWCEPNFTVAPAGTVALGRLKHADWLHFDRDEWAAFTAGMKAGEFDLYRLLPGFKTSSGVGERSGVGDAPAAAATGAGGGAVLPVPVAAQDVPAGRADAEEGDRPGPTNLQLAHAIVLSELRGRASKIEQAEQIVADLHDAGLLVDDVAADADDMLRQAAAPLVPVEPGSAPPDCACWACMAWHRGIVS